MGIFSSKHEDPNLSLLPNNGHYNVGDIVKYVPNVDARKTIRALGFWEILKVSKDQKTYHIRNTTGGGIKRKVPYFLLCPPNEELFVDHLIQCGMHVVFNKRNTEPKNSKGVVVKVRYLDPVVEGVYQLDIRDKFSGDTYFYISHYALDLDLYTKQITKGDTWGVSPIESRLMRSRRIADTIWEEWEEHNIKRNPAPFGWTIRDIRLDLKFPKFPISRLGLDGLAVARFNTNHFRREVAQKIVDSWGHPWRLHVVAYGCEVGYYAQCTKKFPPGFACEIQDRALLPTDHCGHGGALYREASDRFHTYIDN